MKTFSKKTYDTFVLGRGLASFQILVFKYIIFTLSDFLEDVIDIRSNIQYLRISYET